MRLVDGNVHGQPRIQWRDGGVGSKAELGPCNQQRLADRVQAWDDGAWVREAALAHARKQATRQQAA